MTKLTPLEWYIISKHNDGKVIGIHYVDYDDDDSRLILSDDPLNVTITERKHVKIERNVTEIVQVTATPVGKKEVHQVLGQDVPDTLDIYKDGKRIRIEVEDYLGVDFLKRFVATTNVDVDYSDYDITFKVGEVDFKLIEKQYDLTIYEVTYYGVTLTVDSSHTWLANVELKNGEIDYNKFITYLENELKGETHAYQ
jgi:hypothetical protein